MLVGFEVRTQVAQTGLRLTCEAQLTLKSKLFCFHLPNNRIKQVSYLFFCHMILFGIRSNLHLVTSKYKLTTRPNSFQFTPLCISHCRTCMQTHTMPSKLQYTHKTGCVLHTVRHSQINPFHAVVNTQTYAFHPVRQPQIHALHDLTVSISLCLPYFKTVINPILSTA